MASRDVLDPYGTTPRPWRCLVATAEPVLWDKITGVEAKLDNFSFSLGKYFQA